MRKLAWSAALVLGMGYLSGCSLVQNPVVESPFADTPAYTAAQRFDIIGRDMEYQWQQVADDTDHALLLRPGDDMTVWNVYHRD